MLARAAGYMNLEVVTESVDAAPIYAGADIYVAASREDSFNLPALEAMACGVPVVLSTRCGLQHWAAGGAISAEPETEAIVAAIRQLLDPLARRDVAETGVARASQMTWDVPAEVVERQAFAPCGVLTSP